VTNEAYGAAVNLINGNGLGINGPGTHSSANDDTMYWMTSSGHPSYDYIIFDLGAEYDLASTTIWNYNKDGGTYPYWMILGASQIDVMVAATDYAFTTVATINPAMAPGTDTVDFSETFALNQSGVRFVLFDFKNSHGYDDYGYGFVGLSEVRFTEVPEPSTITMLGLASLLLVRRRKMN
jgi:hypothetical protein